MKTYLVLLFLVTSQIFKISSSEFYDMLNDCENSVLLDVRIYEDYCESRIPGAIWAGQKVILDSLLKQLDKNSTFFIYCEMGERTKDVVKILRKAKIKNIIELSGGFETWKKENFPVDEERQVF